MPAKPNSRNWNDVQTAIATVTVVTTLGLWNLFAQPSKTVSAQSADAITPPTEPPAEPTVIPQVKIMFTQVAPQSSVVTTQQTTTKKSNKKNNNNSGGGTVTQTKTS